MVIHFILITYKVQQKRKTSQSLEKCLYLGIGNKYRQRGTSERVGIIPTLKPILDGAGMMALGYRYSIWQGWSSIVRWWCDKSSREGWARGWSANVWAVRTCARRFGHQPCRPDRTSGSRVKIQGPRMWEKEGYHWVRAVRLGWENREKGVRIRVGMRGAQKASAWKGYAGRGCVQLQFQKKCSNGIFPPQLSLFRNRACASCPRFHQHWPS